MASKIKSRIDRTLDFSESEERLILEEKAAFEKMQNTAKQLHESLSLIHISSTT